MIVTNALVDQATGATEAAHSKPMLGAPPAPVPHHNQLPNWPQNQQRSQTEELGRLPFGSVRPQSTGVLAGIGEGSSGGGDQAEARASLPPLPSLGGRDALLPTRELRDARGGGRAGGGRASSSTVLTPPHRLNAHGGEGRMSPDGGSVRGASFSSETGSVVVHEEGSYIRCVIVVRLGVMS